MAEFLSRTLVEAQIVAGGGIAPVERTVHLPVADVMVRVLPPAPAKQVQIGAWVQARLKITDPDKITEEQSSDANYLGIIGALRWALVDETGGQIFASYDQFTSWLNGLDVADFRSLMDGFMSLGAEVAAITVDEGNGS